MTAPPIYPSPAWFALNGYRDPKPLPDGRWQVIAPMLFTTGILIVQDHLTAAGRWCFEDAREAERVHKEWTFDGKSNPPGRWIKRKGFDGDHLNPDWAKE